jgi:DNA mismatch repair ATPase MutL
MHNQYGNLPKGCQAERGQPVTASAAHRPRPVAQSALQPATTIRRAAFQAHWAFMIASEEFGGSAVRIAAVPALLTREDSEAAIRALVQDLEGLEAESKVEDALKRIAATMACHAAVKANYPLTSEKMAHILEELQQTAYSTICPHGRPVMLRLTRREVEKNFQRI